MEKKREKKVWHVFRETRIPERMFEALVTTMLRAPELMGKRQQRQDALDFCTSHLHTEMEARHCLGVLMAPNSDGPVKYGED